MAYLNNIPQPSDQIASSQPEILGNFEYIQTTMQVDHAWAGDGISPSIDGTHQTLSMPNQASDITSLGSTGCALIGYAIAGNLYTWNGAKNPVSGVSGGGTIGITASFVTILTLPANCIGKLMIQVPNASQFYAVCDFYSSGGSLFISPSSPNANFIFQVSGLNLQAKYIGSYTANYKYIYWPI